MEKYGGDFLMRKTYNLENTNSSLLVFDFLPEASLPTIYRNPAKTCQ